MKFARVLLALSLALGLSVAAQAKVTNLGTLSNGDTGFFDGDKGANSSFSDIVNFTLAHTSDLTGGFFAADIQGFKLTLEGIGSSVTGISAGKLTFGTYSFADLAAGAYTFDITGKAGNVGGAYLSGFGVSAVPEADTWLMMLIGICLVSHQLRRKQRSLVQRPLSQV